MGGRAGSARAASAVAAGPPPAMRLSLSFWLCCEEGGGWARAPLRRGCWSGLRVRREGGALCAPRSPGGKEHEARAKGKRE